MASFFEFFFSFQREDGLNLMNVHRVLKTKTKKMEEALTTQQGRTLDVIEREMKQATICLDRLKSERWNHEESKKKRVKQFDDFTWEKYGFIKCHIKDLYCGTDRRGEKQTLAAVELSICMEDGKCIRRSILKSTMVQQNTRIEDLARGLDGEKVDFYDCSASDEYDPMDRVSCMFLLFLFDFASLDTITQRERDSEWVFPWQW